MTLCICRDISSDFVFYGVITEKLPDKIQIKSCGG